MLVLLFYLKPENKEFKSNVGPTGSVKLHFSDKYTKFQDLAPDDPALRNPDFSEED